MEERPLHTSHALVTGGTRGIGAAIVYELALLGAAVTIVGRDSNQLEKVTTQLSTEFEQAFHGVPGDVTDPVSIAGAFDSARAELGDPTILINNAGAVETATFLKTDPEMWHRMMDVNLTSVYHACQEALPAMLKAGDGRIVNVASTAGIKGYRYTAAYVAAKHAVVGLTKSLALETAESGVTVNAVCPGYTDTDSLRDSMEKVSKKTGRSIGDIREEFAQFSPQGRLVQPEEVANAVGWLCLPGQRSVTGTAMLVDGGQIV